MPGHHDTVIKYHTCHIAVLGDAWPTLLSPCNTDTVAMYLCKPADQRMSVLQLLRMCERPALVGLQHGHATSHGEPMGCA